MRPLAPALALLLAVSVPSPSPPSSAPLESEAYSEMAVELLRSYLRIDTTVPPGHELKAALFYKEILDREGIPAEVDEFAPGRANILATLKGSGVKGPLVLLNHMDVVPADPSRWSVPPFSGLLKDGMVYGRGAEDMKTEGILQLLALIRLKREGVRHERDVLFLGTADEEAGFAGALRALAPEGWRERLSRAEFLVTEGGENLMDDDGRPVYFGVETAEKGALWLTLRTTGTPGHGSRPIDDSAVNRMIRALERVRLHKTDMKVLASVDKFFRDQAGGLTAPRAGWYRDIRRALRDPAVARTLYDDRDVSALLRNTVSITVLRAGYKTNVIPGTAEAELDVRLLPGEDPAAFLDELRKAIDDPGVEILEPRSFYTPNESPTDTELFRVIEGVLGRHYLGVPVTTKMLTGGTESVLFRPLGIVCYGFTPLLTTAAETSTTHGDDERINEATVRKSTGIFYEIVRELAGAGASALREPIPLVPGTWWEYRESYTERIGALDSTSDDTTRFEIRGSTGRLFILQTGGADPAPGPLERGRDWIRLAPWTGEQALPLPLEVGRSGPPEEGGRPGWTVEAEEPVAVPAGAFRALRCALRTRRSESVLWVAPGVGVVRETQGAPGERPEIERVLLRWRPAR